METTTETKKETAYKTLLSELETEKAVSLLKSYFSGNLSKRLNLVKVEAPLIVTKESGVNDDLNGIEKPVNVQIKEMPSTEADIVHSLAKWKREKLARLQSPAGEGLYTDMRALRPDEDLSDVHSIYVDQWDWEKVILESNRTLEYLKLTVDSIYKSILDTENYLYLHYPALTPELPKQITYIHAEELLALYPELTPKEREHEIARAKGAVFIIGIGAKLKDGKKHDGRAPDYDDWITESEPGKRGLNGDIIVWNKTLKRAFEISSMGIRVSRESLRKQLLISGNTERLDLPWHKKLINGELPYTIGGGIGQSRLSMLLLKKKHIGEVQSSIWPADLTEELRLQNINLL